MGAQKGHVAVVRCLHKLGAPLTEKDDDGNTPAHFAALKGNEAMVRCLYKCGAPLTEKDDDGHTPAHIAALEGHVAELRRLLKLGPVWTPVLLACQNCLEAFRRFLHGLDA